MAAPRQAIVPLKPNMAYCGALWCVQRRWWRPSWAFHMHRHPWAVSGEQQVEIMAAAERQTQLLHKVYAPSGAPRFPLSFPAVFPSYSSFFLSCHHCYLCLRSLLSILCLLSFRSLLSLLSLLALLSLLSILCVLCQLLPPLPPLPQLPLFPPLPPLSPLPILSSLPPLFSPFSLSPYFPFLPPLSECNFNNYFDKNIRPELCTLYLCNVVTTVQQFRVLCHRRGISESSLGVWGRLPHCLPVGVGVDVGGRSLIKPTANSRELGTNCLFYTLVKLTVSLVI